MPNAHPPLRLHLAEDAMPTVTPRRLFPSRLAAISLTADEWQALSDCWALRWFAALSDGATEAAAEYKAMADHCRTKAEETR